MHKNFTFSFAPNCCSYYLMMAAGTVDYLQHFVFFFSITVVSFPCNNVEMRPFKSGNSARSSL